MTGASYKQLWDTGVMDNIRLVENVESGDFFADCACSWSDLQLIFMLSIAGVLGLALLAIIWLLVSKRSSQKITVEIPAALEGKYGADELEEGIRSRDTPKKSGKGLFGGFFGGVSDIRCNCFSSSSLFTTGIA